MPKRGRSENYSLTPEQVRATLAACQDLTDLVVIKTPLYLGLRVGEMAHFNKGWILGEKEVMIPASMWCDCGECAKSTRHPGEWTPKYKASQRRIPLTDPVRDDILRFFHTSPNGLEMSRFTICRHAKRIMKKARVRFPGLGGDTSFPHALRSTCATMLASAGLNEAQLCRIMGWASMKSAEPYIRLAAAQKGASDAMNEAFKRF